LEVTGYNVYRDDALVNTEPVRDTRSYTDVVPQNGEYKYAVTALYGTLESEPCDPVMVTIDGLCMPVDVFSVEQPDNQVYAILVSWEAPEYEGLELVGYNILRNAEQINTEIITELSYLDEDESLEPEVNYCYQIEVVYNDCEDVIITEEKCLTMDTVSINELQNQVKIYPNPTDGQLIIEISDMRYEMCDITIYDVYGRKAQVSSLKSQVSNHQIDLSHLPVGVYFIKIDSDNGSITQKIVIK
jgi:hypothetical protein